MICEENKIGESRLTKVYRQSLNGKPIALKVYTHLRMQRLKSYDFEQMKYTDGRDFLARELAAYALLREAGGHEQFIPAFHGKFIDEKSVGLQLELADGPLLSFDEERGVYLRTALGKKLTDPLRRTAAVRQMLEALAFVHQQGLAHLDVKPDNFLSFGGRLKLLDFNCARPFAPSARHRLSYGTFLFGAPETFFELDAGYDPFKADVWALAVCVFALVEEHLPFAKEGAVPSQIEYELATKSVQPVFVRATHSEREFIRKGLTKDAQLRPSAAELLADPLFENGAPITVA